jgi:NAD(P)-dependent dehydrogenase (short-subunit alcohol dehydrogenase family)
MIHDFTGLNVLVSGSGSGLGRSTAQYLASLGAFVCVSDINAAACEETVSLIREAGGRVFGQAADLSRRDAFLGVAAAFAEAAGPIGAVINNASVLRYQAIENIEESTVDLMLAGGLKTVFWGAQAMLAHMDPAKGGSIINYSSPVSYRGYPTTGVYSAVKGAVHALTRVMAAELGPKGVRVNALAPGSVPTPGATAYVSQEEYAKRASSIPLRRLGSDDDNARAAAFLLGPEATFINGAVLNVDGGIVAAG